MGRTNLPGVGLWLLVFGVLLLSGAHQGAFGQAVPVVAPAASVPSAFEVASAQLDARDTLKSLSSEGQLLYQRERVKLSGYQYCSQAVAQAERGDFRDSLQSAAKALHIGEMQGNDDLIAVSKRDLAIAYNYAGDLDNAKRYAEQALTHRAKNPALVAGPAYKTLGDVAARRGDFDEAIALYGQAAGSSSERFRPLVQLSLANAYVAKKDAAKARALYDALPALQGTLVPLYHRGIGNLLLIEGRPSDALSSFEAAGRSASGTDADYHRVWAVEGSARALLALGDKAAARARYLEAVKLSEAFRARFRSDEFKTGLFGSVQQIFDGAINLLAEEGDDAGAWSLSERSRSRALLDVLRDRVKSPASAGDHGLEAAEVAKLSDVTAMLRENETLLQFHSLDARLLVWTITASGLKATSLPVPRAELKSLIEAFRSLVRSRLLGATDASTALYDRLLASLVLPAGNSLVIVPHGDLHYLPFQALRSPDGFLIERHPIAVEPSASVAVQLRRRHAEAGGRLVAFGNPVNTAPFDLPAAEREVQSISQMFADRQVYFHENASKSRFREAAGSGRILLVAAHAELDPNDVLASKIRLAAETDDLGFLLAREIYGLDLTGVSLVTLSACSSGLGRIVGGGDLVGFTRSFLSAGASSLLVSLWPVDDVSTQLLMSTFYSQLTKGIEAIDALRVAQLAVLARPRSGHPYYWAPFNLIGDWRLQINQ